MRVAIVGNLAGAANEVLVGLRKAGIEADLYVGHDDYLWVRDNLGGHRELKPEWIHCFEPGLQWAPPPVAHAIRKFYAYGLQRGAMMQRLLRYDVLHAHTGALNFSVAAWLAFVRMRLRPYLAFATGSDIREVAMHGSGFRAEMMRDFFQRANEVLLLNGDLVRLRAPLRLQHARFFPFVINEEKYAPVPAPDRPPAYRGKLLCYMMSRLDFGQTDNAQHRSSMKGNERFFYALDRFRREDARIHALVIDHGTDREVAHRLVRELDLGDFVTFVPRATEPERIRLMAMADVALDQFHVGAFGLGALELMAMGKPLITYYRQDCVADSYGEEPPILNAETADEILARLLEARDGKLRSELGERARQWIVKQHSRGAVIPRLIELYRGALDGREPARSSAS